MMSSLVRSGHFGLGGLPLRLERATIALKAWCKMNRRNVVFRKFSADNLTFKRGKVPEMKAKGYDCFVVLAWLAAEFPSDRDDLRMEYALIWLADSAMQVLSHAGSFLTDLEAEHVRVVGEQFLKVWIAAAHGRPMQFKVRPKFHILHHAFLEASSRPSRRNVWEDGTWMDEDWIKKISWIIKKTHRRTSPRTVLQRYLVFLRQELGIAVAG